MMRFKQVFVKRFVVIFSHYYISLRSDRLVRERVGQSRLSTFRRMVMFSPPWVLRRCRKPLSSDWLD